MLRRRYFIAGCLAWLAIVSCSDDVTGPPGSGRNTALVTEAYVIETQVGQVYHQAPWIECLFRLNVSATTAASTPLRLSRVVFEFYAGAVREEPIDSSTVNRSTLAQAFGGTTVEPGGRLESGWRLRAGVPFSLRGRVHYSDGDGAEGAAPFALDCGPTISEQSPEEPPIVGDVRILPASEQVEAGDPIRVDYHVVSGLGLWQTWVIASGPLGEDTIRLTEGLRGSSNRSVDLHFPGGTPLGSRLRIRVVAFDAALRGSASAEMPTPALIDTRPPYNATFGLAFPHEPCVPRTCQFASDSALRVYIGGFDYSGLGWARLHLGDPVVRRDSIWVGTEPAPLRFAPPAGLAGVYRLWGSMEDRHGNAVEFPDLGEANVFPAYGDSLTTADTLGYYATPHADFALSRLYAAVPGQSALEVYDIETLARLQDLRLRGAPAGIDFTENGVVIAALPDEHAIELLDPVGFGSRAITITAIGREAGFAAADVALTSRGTVLVAMRRHRNAWEGNSFVMAIDTADGTQTIVVDSLVGETGHYYLSRSGDGRKVVIMRSTGCARVYYVESGVLGECSTMTEVPVGDETGSLWVSARGVYDGSLVRTATVPAIDWHSVAPIPGSGREILVAGSRGLLRVDHETGLISESRALPELYRGRLWVSPDGSRAVAAGRLNQAINSDRTALFVVDLD